MEAVLSSARSTPCSLADPAFDAGALSEDIAKANSLRRDLRSLIASNAATVSIGEDEVVERLLRRRGFCDHDLVVERMGLGTRRITVVCIPERQWINPASMVELIGLKRLTRAGGRTVLLVPEAAVQREPRLATARAIETAMATPVSAEDRMAVLRHLIEMGYSPLQDCACVVAAEAPYSAILAMVGMGAVKMDRNRPITPDTRIDLPDDRDPGDI